MSCVGGKVGILRRDRVRNQGVFADGGGKTVGILAGEAPDAHEVSADGVQRRAEVGVVDGVVEGSIEPSDQVVVVLPPFAAKRRAVELGGERRERGRVGVRRGKARRSFFERPAELEQGTDVISIDVGHDSDPRRLLHDEPVCSQARERLTQWRTAHTEAGRLLDFAEHGTRG